MHLLLTNDDGIKAPGLLALASSLAELGKVSIVAPHRERSGVGHAITYREPLLVNSVRRNGDLLGYSVNGFPADCIKLGLAELITEPVDLVISGINAGINPGIHVLYSGTVAAALEAAYHGIPALAVSLTRDGGVELAHFQTAARIVRPLIERALAGALAPGQLWNINIPGLHSGLPRGVRVCRQATDGWRETFERRTSPGGQSYYWVTGTMEFETPDESTDIGALEDGYVALTPLTFDLTDTKLQAELESIDWAAVVQGDST